MTGLLLVCLGLTVAIYVAAFHFMPHRVQGWLMRHPASFMLLNLLTIPMMVAMFGAGLIAGAVNLGSSAIFAAYLGIRRRRLEEGGRV